jgi:tRNA A37 threonylcarbamoyltransferase TsaD
VRNKLNQYFYDTIIKFFCTKTRRAAGYLALRAFVIASGFAANDIRQIGVQFATGDPYEGGSFTSPIDVVFHIDSITAQ